VTIHDSCYWKVIHINYSYIGILWHVLDMWWHARRMEKDCWHPKWWKLSRHMATDHYANNFTESLQIQKWWSWDVLCIFPTSGQTCHSLDFQHFCGKVIGYQKGSDDGFHTGDSIYLDGVSITYGYVWKHLWSLAIGASSEYNHPVSNCPCAKYPS